ncbi:MGMT family protein [Natronobacterium texcoconense]|uniref:Methylated-DNA-[protein]-cysteine S-methyltransferase n=1 Tax=Natronobacterium texcoconense TaxID=1095778 RepID=A0A1H1ADM5_NATTX|nr:MGMT family protein [Natronobacterium texcoconense]SDQ37737.1 methylated-DNA-[protein]-cysteine S-methyltransferase [Natronobacterium texcoconense]
MEDVTDAGIYARESSYLDCYVQLGVASGRVLDVSFPDHPDDEATVVTDDSEESPVLERIFEYLDGLEEVTFDDVQVALTVPTDQRSILEQVRQIPYGDQVGVEALTRMTPELDADDEDDQILVRTALDANPAPILIPDHRVRDGPSAAPPAVEQKLRSLEGL